MKQMAIVVCYDETQISSKKAFKLLNNIIPKVEEAISEEVCDNGFPENTIIDREDAIFVDDRYDD